MAQFGSDKLSAAQSTNGISDVYGVPLISTFNDFGASPLGIAARSQALYGIANAQFNLTPEDTDSEIVDSENALPYWSVSNYSAGRIVPKSFYDLTTSTWSVELNPTAGSAADYLELKTRSYLLTDDNLALRQKAYLTMSKGTAYAGATQFNVVLSAEYFDVNGTSLSSYAIGTALDNGAMTSITGITTSGSAAINAAAAYVDFTITLTATATVTSGVKVYLKSFLIQTSQAATGSFLISETITSSQTWAAPTGVSNLVVVVVGGAGGGGGGGGGIRGDYPRASGGGGGGGGAWSILRDVSLGTASSVSIGIGAGGTGGTAMNYTVIGAAVAGTVVGGVGAAGGATTFGSYISVPGGAGGGGGTARGTTVNHVGTVLGGTAGLAGGTVTFTFYGGASVLGGGGGVGGSAVAGNFFAATAGGTAAGLAFANYPYSTFSAGATGGNGSWAGTGDRGSASNGVAGGSAHFGGGGGGGAGLYWSDSGASGTNYTRIGDAGVGGAGAGGGGGGGAGARMSVSAGTASIVAGTGGNGGTISIAGGGGGGGAICYGLGGGTLNLTVKAGPGGTGSSGFVTVVYVA